jgi:hypothetical protein
MGDEMARNLERYDLGEEDDDGLDPNGNDRDSTVGSRVALFGDLDARERPVMLKIYHDVGSGNLSYLDTMGPETNEAMIIERFCLDGRFGIQPVDADTNEAVGRMRYLHISPTSPVLEQVRRSRTMPQQQPAAAPGLPIGSLAGMTPETMRMFFQFAETQRTAVDVEREAANRIAQEGLAAQREAATLLAQQAQVNADASAQRQADMLAANNAAFSSQMTAMLSLQMAQMSAERERLAAQMEADRQRLQASLERERMEMDRVREAEQNRFDRQQQEAEARAERERERDMTHFEREQERQRLHNAAMLEIQRSAHKASEGGILGKLDLEKVTGILESVGLDPKELLPKALGAVTLLMGGGGGGGGAGWKDILIEVVKMAPAAAAMMAQAQRDAEDDDEEEDEEGGAMVQGGGSGMVPVQPALPQYALPQYAPQQPQYVQGVQPQYVQGGYVPQQQPQFALPQAPVQTYYDPALATYVQGVPPGMVQGGMVQGAPPPLYPVQGQPQTQPPQQHVQPHVPPPVQPVQVAAPPPPPDPLAELVHRYIVTCADNEPSTWIMYLPMIAGDKINQLPAYFQRWPAPADCLVAHGASPEFAQALVAHLEPLLRAA